MVPLSLKSYKMISIAIPHHNDVRGLMETLDAIIIQNLNHFEIVISDNGSPKGTMQYITETYAPHIPSLKFYQNQKNLGYDKNVDLCLIRASGHFVWLMGCGDIPEVADLKKFVELLKTNQEAVNVMPSVANKAGNSSQYEQKTDDSRRITLKEGTFLSEFYNSACSGNIINRAQTINACREPLKSKNWCHVERVLQSLVSGGERTYAVKTSVCTVKIKTAQDGWWVQDDEIFLFNFLSHRKIIKQYHEHGALGICRLPRFSNSNLLLFRAILFSKQINKRASPADRLQVDALIQENRVAQILNVAGRHSPKKINRLAYRVGANLLNFLGLRKFFSS